VFGRVGITVLALAALVWPMSARTTEPGLAGTGWRIVEVAGRPADPGATIAFEKTRISGSTGCNRFFASLTVTDAAIAVGPIATTKMFCGPRAGIERDTLAALAQVARVRRDGGAKVALLDASGKAIVLLGR
jgi:putative lipoprotein